MFCCLQLGVALVLEPHYLTFGSAAAAAPPPPFLLLHFNVDFSLYFIASLEFFHKDALSLSLPLPLIECFAITLIVYDCP